MPDTFQLKKKNNNNNFQIANKIMLASDQVYLKHVMLRCLGSLIAG